MTRTGKLVTLVALGLVLLVSLGWEAFALMGWLPKGTAPVESKQSSPAPLLDLDIDPSQLKIKSWHFLDGFPHEIAQFQTVFWEPRDTTSLRTWLNHWPTLPSSKVLEIGTGTGLVALHCGLRGAQVVATDINPNAVANAAYNAEIMNIRSRIEVRRVPEEQPGPFSVIAADEKFDLILSNPPWEEAPVQEVAAYALYDPGFALLDGLLTESRLHLRPGGRLLLAYGSRAAIERILKRAPELGWQVAIHDERSIQSLPTVFVPGMLLELQPE